MSTLAANTADSLSGHSLMNSVELARQDKLHVFECLRRDVIHEEGSDVLFLAAPGSDGSSL